MISIPRAFSRSLIYTLVLISAIYFQSLTLISNGEPLLQGSGTIGASREISLLFDDELQQVQKKIKWHGERLTEDTVYAAALTGQSWYTEWESHRLFSLTSEKAGKKGDLNKFDQILRDAETDYQIRHSAWQTAKRSGRRKEAIVLGLSLIFASGDESIRHDSSPLQFVAASGVDVERVCLGILQAPEGLKGFVNFWYSAANLLSLRANPRLLPYLLHLANSDDTFLRSRAILGLGVVGYQSRPADPPDWARSIISVPLHEYGLSVGERKLLTKAILEAARSDRHLIRASASTALALVAEDESMPLLQKLAKDRAYILSSEIAGTRARRISFPVRSASMIGLERFSVISNTIGGEYSGKALESAKRGGQDVSNDHHNLRKDSDSILCLENSQGMEYAK